MTHSSGLLGIYIYIYHLHEKLAIINHYIDYGGFPGGSEVKASAHNVGDPRLIPGSSRSHGGRSLVGYSTWGCKESDKSE